VLELQLQKLISSFFATVTPDYFNTWEWEYCFSVGTKVWALIGALDIRMPAQEILFYALSIAASLSKQGCTKKSWS